MEDICCRSRGNKNATEQGTMPSRNYYIASVLEIHGNEENKNNGIIRWF